MGRRLWHDNGGVAWPVVESASGAQHKAAAPLRSGRSQEGGEWLIEALTEVGGCGRSEVASAVASVTSVWAIRVRGENFVRKVLCGNLVIKS